MTPALPASQWERIHARELRLSVTHPPANAWEEMAVWTGQGKLWHLPVDNEQGTTRGQSRAWEQGRVRVGRGGGSARWQLTA